ncbi:SIR2 family protein [Chitinophaga sp. CC14]|uniref:SIR2 family protein n=1 Tax=Chitinophaga sp. CC14 TaxID=3029199 RepID=UPI003B792E69
MVDFDTEFQKHISSFGTLPYLFVGSGLSRRYLNIPTWSALLEEFSVQMKLELPFDYYASKCPDDLPQLASNFAADFHKLWWSSIDFTKSRLKYKSIASINEELPLKIELSEIVNSYNKAAEGLENEISLLQTSTISGIITTNWDTFLSDLFPDFQTYIGQKELLFSNNLSVGDIYKIHGCVTKPDSLVVTKADYTKFKDQNTYLAAKLLTIFVEHPIIFLGYSLSDENIIEILDAIVSCLDKSNIDKLKDRLIFIEWKREKISPTISDTVIKVGNSILPIKLVQTNDFTDIFKVLNQITHKLPMKLLKKLKSSVYDLVKTDTPSKILYYGNLGDLKESDELDFVVGVGLSQNESLQKVGLQKFGYKSPQAKDIIQDVLFDDIKFDSNDLIQESLPNILTKRIFCPHYKYLRSAGFLAKDGTLNKIGKSSINGAFELRKDIPNCFYPGAFYTKNIKKYRTDFKHIKDLLNSGFEKKKILEILPLLTEDALDLEVLKDFLQQCSKDNALNNQTSFRKVACYYDYLKNAKN